MIAMITWMVPAVDKWIYQNSSTFSLARHIAFSPWRLCPHGDGVRAGILMGSSPPWDGFHLSQARVLSQHSHSCTPPSMKLTGSNWRHLIGIVAATLAAVCAWSYWPTIVELAEEWANNPLYSHGYLVPVFAVALLWIRREHILGKRVARTFQQFHDRRHREQRYFSNRAGVHDQ